MCFADVQTGLNRVRGALAQHALQSFIATRTARMKDEDGSQ